MSWRNPWAWLGLLSIAVPIVIHLLTRRTARVQRFPTLRFFTEPRRVPARRVRLHDPLLLAIRVLVLVAAVAALAQPYFVTAARERRAAGTIARAIIVDTSASMARNAASGGTAIDAARDSVRAWTDAVAASVIETASLAHALAGAAAWLETQPGTREIVIVSDFQVGTIDSADVAAVPPGIGVRFHPIAVAVDTMPIALVESGGAIETTALVTHAADAATVTWTFRRADSRTQSALRVLAPDSASARARAVLDAALAAGAPFHADTTRRVAIVFADEDAGPVELADQAWMGAVIAALGTHVYAGAVANADSSMARPLPERAARPPLERAARPLLERAARGVIDGHEHLLLYTSAEPGSLDAAQLVTAVLHALDASAPAAEHEPAFIPTQTLATWARPARVDAAAPAVDASDGRWFWLVVLVLLGIESWLARRRVHAIA